jgi:hypothetical protein
MIVTGGALIKCVFGDVPSPLMVLPMNRVVQTLPVANIMDMAPFLNILPFGTCKSILNPMVAAATAAALGVLTPMPCIPMPAGPWTPGNPKVLVGNMPVVDQTSLLMCAYGGVIQVVSPGQGCVSD